MDSVWPLSVVVSILTAPSSLTRVSVDFTTSPSTERTLLIVPSSSTLDSVFVVVVVPVRSVKVDSVVKIPVVSSYDLLMSSYVP